MSSNQVLAPNANGFYNELSGGDWSNLVSAGGNAGSTTTDQRGFYKFPAITLPANNKIQKVVVSASMKSLGSGAWAYLGILSSGVLTYGSQVAVGGSYATYTAEFTTDPATGADWSENAVNYLQGGVRMHGGSGGTLTYIDWISLTVYYIDGSQQKISFTIRPNGPGLYNELSPNGSSNYQIVNTENGSSTVYANDVGSYKKDLYTSDDISLPGGYRITRIVIVTKNVFAFNYAYFSKVKHFIRSGSTEYLGSEFTNSGLTQVLLYTVLDTDPNTGAAWTQDGINALQMGVQLYRAHSATSAEMQWEKIVVYAEYYNTAPNTPSTPSGPERVGPGTSYEYSSTTTDPDGNNVYYLFDWGDGQQSNTGWLASGQTGALSHIWASPGIYGLKVASCDTFGFWSGWSAILYVQVVSPSGRGQVIGLW
jgi:hypothetical protein